MDGKNVIEQMIGYLSTPIAKKKGVTISAEECAIWVDEMKKFMLSESSQHDKFLSWLYDYRDVLYSRSDFDAYYSVKECIEEFKRKFEIR